MKSWAEEEMWGGCYWVFETQSLRLKETGHDTRRDLQLFGIMTV